MNDSPEKKKRHRRPKPKLESMEEVVQKYLDSDGVLAKIEKTTNKFPELSERERDFAQRCALENRTPREWAQYYRITEQGLFRWLRKKEVQQIIREIKSDARRYHIAKALYLGEEALRVYQEVLRTPITNNNRSEILRAANEILAHLKEGLSDKTKSPIEPSAISVNFIGTQGGVAPPAANDEVQINVIAVKAEKKEDGEQ